ncbi:MAG: tetratricopeptide repeat protein [Kofleriaceae bacterium]
MNRVLACAVVLASLPVLAGPVRKPPTAAYPGDALNAFAEAVLADKRGDLDTAKRRYLDSNRLSPQAHTFYNLADVYRRMEQPEHAVEALAKYLELAPAAADRTQVEKLVAQLSREATVVIDGDDFDGVILVDGKLVGPSPAVLQLPAGTYLTDRISPTSFESRIVTLRAPRAEHVKLAGSNKQTGNVVLAGNRGHLITAWDHDGASLRIPGRLQLAPGRHTLTPTRACAPIVIDVPREPAAVAYVFVDVKATETGCFPISTKLQTLRLGARP